MRSLRTTALSAMIIAAIAFAAPASAHASAVEKTARTITRVEAKIAHLTNSPDTRERDYEVDRLRDVVHDLERTNDGYGDAKIVRRNRARLDNLHVLLSRLENGYTRAETRHDDTFNGRVDRQRDHSRRHLKRDRKTSRRVSARLDQLDATLDTVRRMNNVRRRAASLEAVSRELHRLDRVNGQQRGRLARKNDARIVKLERRVARISRRSRHRTRNEPVIRWNHGNGGSFEFRIRGGDFLSR